MKKKIGSLVFLVLLFPALAVAEALVEVATEVVASEIPTRIIVFFIAFVVLILATYFTQGLSWNTALLTVINAVIVALTAMGGYELTFKKIEDRKKEKEEENK